MFDIKESIEKIKTKTQEGLQKLKEERAENKRQKDEERKLKEQAFREGYERTLSEEDEKMLFDRETNRKIEEYTRTEDTARKAAIRRSVLADARRKGQESAEREYRIEKARKDFLIGNGLGAGATTIGRQILRTGRNFADVDFIGRSYPFGGFGIGMKSKRKKASKRRFREPNLLRGSFSFGRLGNLADYDPITGKVRKNRRK